MASTLNYRESAKPPEKVQSFLIVRECVSSLGVTTYLIVEGFRGTNAKEVAMRWWRTNQQRCVGFSNDRFWLWTFEQYEKASGRKFVMMGW